MLLEVISLQKGEGKRNHQSINWENINNFIPNKVKTLPTSFQILADVGLVATLIKDMKNKSQKRSYLILHPQN